MENDKESVIFKEFKDWMLHYFDVDEDKLQELFNNYNELREEYKGNILLFGIGQGLNPRAYNNKPASYLFEDQEEEPEPYVPEDEDGD